MGSREKKGSTEELEIQVGEWWGPGTQAIPKGAANVLRMGLGEMQGAGPWSPHHKHLKGAEPSWAICGVGQGRRGPEKLDHATCVSLETWFLLPWERRAHGRFRVQPAEQSLQWLLGKCSCISLCPQQWQTGNTSRRKYLGFSSNSCCLCVEDMQRKGLDLLSKTVPCYCNVFKQNPKHSKKDRGRCP